MPLNEAHLFVVFICFGEILAGVSPLAATSRAQQNTCTHEVMRYKDHFLWMKSFRHFTMAHANHSKYLRRLSGPKMIFYGLFDSCSKGRYTLTMTPTKSQTEYAANSESIKSKPS